MKVGDLVRMKSLPDELGLIINVDPNLGNSVSYSVCVEWCTSTKRGIPKSQQYSWQIEVIQ